MHTRSSLSSRAGTELLPGKRLGFQIQIINNSGVNKYVQMWEKQHMTVPIIIIQTVILL